EAPTKSRSRWTGACFSGAWRNGLVRRLRRWGLAVPGLHRRQRPMLGFGSTDGVLVAADGLIDGVLAEVDGSTGGE
ncbi:MAG: hypothetical protein QOH31_6451, partial [Verrucomicrobiota bacterium]